MSFDKVNELKTTQMQWAGQFKVPLVPALASTQGRVDARAFMFHP